MPEITFITGGVTAAQGFSATGEHVGIRRNRARRDLALVVSETPASAACVYTQNQLKGAPILVTREHMENGMAQAIVCNSGNANTCSPGGVELARNVCALVEQYVGVPARDVIVASTGVVGQPMSIEPFASGMGRLADSLEATPTGGRRAAEAIMTTDTVPKEAAVRFPLGGKLCKLGGMAKGSGMIAPNMATMLCFLTTDAAISPVALRRALSTVVGDTFNMLSVDGDASTNDMACILANGMAGNPVIETCMGAEYEAFVAALYQVAASLCAQLARDGEGATKLMVCDVTGARTGAAARAVAKTVVQSTLLKAAIFGADANWGRVLNAIGNAGVELDMSKVDVNFRSKRGIIAVCRGGMGVAFSEENARDILLDDEITIQVALNSGAETARAWGCDLSYDYVKINGDYRT